MNNSKDGFQWTPEHGLQHDLPTLGAIDPLKKHSATSQVYDVIVIGAGYAGLTATRDLTTTGHKVLLLEARDRIGGRTWSSNLDGYPFELGGTWIHWNQPHVYKEISRYGLQDDLENSHDLTRGINSFLVKTGGQFHKMSRAEEGQTMDKVLRKFVNVDGTFCRTTIPMPGSPSLGSSPAVQELDKLSLRDRLNQIESELSSIEKAVLEGFLAITCGARDLADASFMEMLRWWALNNYDMALFMEQCLTYKLRSGQSNFARHFFDEALATGRLEYRFNAVVKSINQDQADGTVTITTEDDNNNTSYHAHRVICTIPLNVLNDVEFTPALPPLKLQAANQGHVNVVNKVHVEAANPDLRSLSGTIAAPYDELTYIFGDGTTPAGNTHLVSFGSAFTGVHLRADEDIEDTKRALQAFIGEGEGERKMDVKRIVSHDWARDRFAKGAWEWLRPGMTRKEVLEGLRERQGRVFFASADWAMLWRGFIDGGIEDGARVARDVARDLRGL